MTEPFALKTCPLIRQFWTRILRSLVGVTRQRTERFDLAHCCEPTDYGGTGSLAPAFDGKGELDRP